MNTYKCPCCDELLQHLEQNQYKCNNSNCNIRDSKITINEGFHDVFICSEETEEMRTENKWCTIININKESEVK